MECIYLQQMPDAMQTRSNSAKKFNKLLRAECGPPQKIIPLGDTKIKGILIHLQAVLHRSPLGPYKKVQGQDESVDKATFVVLSCKRGTAAVEGKARSPAQITSIFLGNKSLKMLGEGDQGLLPLGQSWLSYPQSWLSYPLTWYHRLVFKSPLFS